MRTPTAASPPVVKRKREPAKLKACHRSDRASYRNPIPRIKMLLTRKLPQVLPRDSQPMFQNVSSEQAAQLAGEYERGERALPATVLKPGYVPPYERFIGPVQDPT